MPAYVKSIIITAMLMVLAWVNSAGQLLMPADTKATAETRRLYQSMQRLSSGVVLFGHHDDTAYGVGWRLEPGRSDIKSVTGSYPAVYGWDLAGIESDSVNDINHIPFNYQRQLVKQAYRRGGINTFCWHMTNPLNGKTAWDTTQRTIKDILPGGSYHKKYKLALDRAARYLHSLKGDDGEPIPVLFHPFHELTGNWFWWGRNTCTPNEFKALWQFTITYLRQTKKLHNVLVVYATADFETKDEFLERYPGNAYADMLGFDNYCNNDVAYFLNKLDKRLYLLNAIAAKHHKLACLPETGYEKIPQADWWTNVLLPAALRL
ncbi:MAG: beta-mannosidase, partial [Sphingobacteriaceae bacterium]